VLPALADSGFLFDVLLHLRERFIESQLAPGREQLLKPCVAESRARGR